MGNKFLLLSKGATAVVEVMWAADGSEQAIPTQAAALAASATAAGAPLEAAIVVPPLN